MLQRFVYITGALDILVAVGLWASTLLDPKPMYFVPMMTLGTFLMMSAACLMWASKDMLNRAPVIFWQGLVRLTAVLALLYAVPSGMANQWEYTLVAFDGTIAIVYIFGMMRVTGGSLLDCLMCRTPAA
ncbi:MAG: hypothetical protein KDI14_08770 [Halioglobus sp.]|nr:hypothetical protein [Halioglobus sp.]